ncbi:uncharacterized protein EI90DRAFT_3125690 [Cantharellus anzutake]|uniref:uncharacterized protein n=1 Tax=Cantharellus anzutake TaxID=1750568 RepID=UPI001908CAF5|nr:uncharacterized protein EI90DRAFT_3125690 [Cantharellus anzutake]KAF8328926.1 hypothetical protein EI90DRAFT_3125690 [Cantharellus anzutake]
MIHDPTQPDKPGSLIVASRKTSFLLSFPLAAQLEPVSPSTPRGSPIETDPDLPSLTSTSTGSLNLSSEQLGILTPPGSRSRTLYPDPLDPGRVPDNDSMILNSNFALLCVRLC